MKCAILENKMNEIYAINGLRFEICGVLDDGSCITNIYNKPKGSGIYVSIKSVGKIIKDFPKTSDEYCIYNSGDIIHFSWKHGEMRITMFVLAHEYDIEQGIVRDAKRINEIIQNITKNTQD
jgi:hypothetical protein